MRRDSIFYRLFQQSPELLFELLEEKPENVKDYRFDSVAVKEPKFEIDGIFLPPASAPPGTIFFCEVQFQKDDRLYARLFSESFAYFYRNYDSFSDWQAVIIYPTKSVEPSTYHPYRSLIESDQVHRIYLDELGAIAQLPLGVALMVLTTLSEQEAPEVARSLLRRTEQEVVSSQGKQGIIEMVNTIMVYKFTNLSRQEIDEMLGTRLEDTRVYREAREEEREAIARNFPHLSRQEIDEMLGTKLEDTRVYREAREEEREAIARDFPHLSRQEIDEMLGTKLEDTRVYREAREEEREAIARDFPHLSRQEIDEMLGTKLEDTRVYQEAQEEKAIAIALNMLKDNLPLEQISRLTGLTIAQLQQLQSENP